MRFETQATIRGLLMSLSLVTTAGYAQQEMPLYGGAIPGAIEAPDEERIREPKGAFPFLLDISRPTLTAYLPAKADANQAAVIVLPGGSYRGVSIEKEGHAVARKLNEFGIAAFVLKYRTPSARHMRNVTLGPLQDVQEAIHTVRTRAGEWKIDPQRVGVMGFSAGGHLASSAGTHFNEPVIARTDKVSLRPDFLVLLYPVINLGDDLAHKVSREMLLGSAPAPADVAKWSNDLQVSATTPPTLLVHAADDSSVPVGNSLRFFSALQAKKIPAELIVFPAGGHGFGLDNATTPDKWADRCRDWLISQRLLDGAKTTTTTTATSAGAAN